MSKLKINPVFFFYFFFLFQSQLFSTLLYLNSEDISAYRIQKTMAKLPNSTKEKKENVNSPNFKEVTVTGYAIITRAGEQDAFDRALEHAFRLAVEKTLGSLVKSETIVKNSTLISDNIYSRSSGFVQSYEIISNLNSNSEKSQSKLVTIKAKIAIEDIKKNIEALALLQFRVGRPLVVVVIEEKTQDGEISDIAKSAIQEALKKNKFELVHEKQLKEIIKNRKTKLDFLSEQNINELLAKTGAQIAIQGRVKTTEQKIPDFEGTGMLSVNTTLTMDAFYISDATIIKSLHQSIPAAAPSLDMAQSIAVKKILKTQMTPFIDGILNHWDEVSNEGFEYNLFVKNVDYSNTKRIKNSLDKNIEGIKKVVIKSYLDNNLHLVVKYQGLLADMAGLFVEAIDDKTRLLVNSYDDKNLYLTVKKL